MSFERARLNGFDGEDGVYLLARRLGKPAGRISAHVVTAGGDGWFGFFDTIDDRRVVQALVDAAQEWLVERGCTTVTGPASFTVDDEAGVLVAGHDVPGVTGRPWHPDWYAPLLEGAGFDGVEDRPTWRLPAGTGTSPPPSGDPPPHSGRYGDRRLALGGVAAVPDIAGPLRDAGPRSAWSLAKRAKARDWEGCTIVRCDGDPSVLVPQIQRAAGAAGYEWVIAPWSPDPAGPPETVHRLYRRVL
jgi:hypothetical protein